MMPDATPAGGLLDALAFMRRRGGSTVVAGRSVAGASAGSEATTPSSRRPIRRRSTSRVVTATATWSPARPPAGELVLGHQPVHPVRYVHEDAEPRDDRVDPGGELRARGELEPTGQGFSCPGTRVYVITGQVDLEPALDPATDREPRRHVGMITPR